MATKLKTMRPSHNNFKTLVGCGSITQSIMQILSTGSVPPGARTWFLGPGSVGPGGALSRLQPSRPAVEVLFFQFMSWRKELAPN